ncbi:PLP-dependent aminotransferase family protein [Agromyces bauzanensis]|nr:PLP-dependent aminotransferase family protein [Agromyces bauzanensis]
MAPWRVGKTHLLELLGGWEQTDGTAYAALAARIRLLIIDGRITPGARLPSERDLAASLALSRTTVNAAYTMLRSEGYLQSRQGSGSVAQIPGRPPELPLPRPGDIIDLSRATCTAAPGTHAAAVRALDRLPPRLTTDGYELAGLPELRVKLAERYSRQGLPTNPEEIFVTSGSQSAISLVARTFVAPGDRVVVESPGYPHAFSALRAAGARLLPFRMDASAGWDVDGFDLAVRRSVPTLAFLMPDFHNPTSRSMTIDERRRVVATAEAHGMVVVSDEATAELALDGQDALPPIASFAHRPGSVIVIGSASKTVWGGLRVGWVRTSVENVDRLIAARMANDLGAAVIDQLVYSEMLTDFEPVLEFRRDALRASRDALQSALSTLLPSWTMSPTRGGIASWVKLDEPVSSAMTIAARARGLLIGAGPWFGLDGEFEQFIRVPITVGTEAIERAVEILADAEDDVHLGSHAGTYPVGARRL